MPKKTLAPIAGVEAELADLTGRRTALAERHVALVIAFDKALSQRRTLLIQDGGQDAAALAKAEDATRAAEGQRLAIEDALAEISRLIEDAERRRDDEAATARQEASAAALERDAAQIEKATADLAAAVKALGNAHVVLSLSITGRAAGLHDPSLGTSPEHIATALMLRGLVAAVPSLDVTANLTPGNLYALPERITAADPVGGGCNLTQAMRDTARAVRAGEASADLPAYQVPVPDFPLNTEEAAVGVLRPFFYERAQNDRVIVTPQPGLQNLPKPVAELAVGRGLAVEQEPADARVVRPLLTSPKSYRWEDCTDLGFSLAEWQAADRDRRRQHWLERQAA